MPGRVGEVGGLQAEDGTGRLPPGEDRLIRNGNHTIVFA